jgi:hypothetical protein
MVKGAVQEVISLDASIIFETDPESQDGIRVRFFMRRNILTVKIKLYC